MEARGGLDIRAGRRSGRHASDRELDFEGLYAEHAEQLLGFLTLRTGDRGKAEDLLADAFERAIRRRTTFKPRRGSPKAWIYAIALNVLRDDGRRRAREDAANRRASSPMTTDEAAQSALRAVEDRDALAHAMGVLTEAEREAVALRFGADLTMPEMAELLSESVTTMEARVYRALRKVRERMPKDP
jgi:RNA polymerase sigma-70 factor, ECF subfamily